MFSAAENFYLVPVRVFTSKLATIRATQFLKVNKSYESSGPLLLKLIPVSVA